MCVFMCVCTCISVDVFMYTRVHVCSLCVLIFFDEYLSVFDFELMDSMGLYFNSQFIIHNLLCIV